jgi:LysM repeat protein
MYKRVPVLAMLLILASGCGQLITPPPPQVTPGVVVPTGTPLPTVPPRATSTPAPATPVPTATPTVTPTPIVYRVESGDTLLAVAANFDVPAELIQEANGIIDPRRLQIGQELIIPRPQPDQEQPPSPTPTPPPMAIRKLNFKPMPLGGLWALGEIYNSGSDPVAEVMVEVSLFDGDGQLLASQTAFPQLDVVPAREAISFAILFDNPPRQFAQYQAVVLAGVPMSPNTRYYLDLVATDLQGQATDATHYRVRGDLKNIGLSDVEDLRLLVTAYDDEARVTAVRQVNLPVSVLRAAATTPFEAELAVTGSPVITYSVQAQGLRVE